MLRLSVTPCCSPNHRFYIFLGTQTKGHQLELEKIRDAHETQSSQQQQEMESLKESHQAQRDQVVELLKKIEHLQEDFDNEIGFREDSIRVSEAPSFFCLRI